MEKETTCTMPETEGKPDSCPASDCKDCKYNKGGVKMNIVEFAKLKKEVEWLRAEVKHNRDTQKVCISKEGCQHQAVSVEYKG